MNIKIRRRIWIPLLLLTLIGGMVLVVFKYEPVVQAFDPNAIKSQIGRRIEWKGRVTAPWGIDIFEDDKAIYAVVPGSREQWGGNPPQFHEVRVKGVVQQIGKDRATSGKQRMIIQLGEWQVEDLGMAQEEIAARSRTPLIIRIKAFQPQRPWIVSYADGRTSNELHLPRLRPVKLKVMSGDGVIHALPGAKLGAGVSAIPNIDSETTWTARELGSYRLPCSEYCGQFHSQCGLTVVVQEEKDFESWLAGLGGQSN